MNRRTGIQILLNSSTAHPCQLTKPSHSRDICHPRVCGAPGAFPLAQPRKNGAPLPCAEEKLEHPGEGDDVLGRLDPVADANTNDLRHVNLHVSGLCQYNSWKVLIIRVYEMC